MRAATELLDAGEYQRLTELLHQVQAAYDQKGDTIPAHVLVLARRICLACSQSQAEADWHRQAREEAAQREEKLRHQLTTLLDLLGERDLPLVPGEWDLIPDVAPAVLGPPGPDSPQEVKSLSLWQRIRGALHWRLGTQPSEAAVSEVPDQGPLPPTLEMVKSRFLPPTAHTDQIMPPPQESVEGPEILSASSPQETERAGKLGTQIAEVSTTSSVHRAKAPPSPPDEIETAPPPTQAVDAAHAHPPEGTDMPVLPVTQDVKSPDALLAENPEETEAPRPPSAERAQAPVPEPAAETERPSEPAEESGVLPPQTMGTAEAAGQTTQSGDEEKIEDMPALAIHCLGPFRVYQDDQPVEDWPSSKGKSIFKYLVINRARPVPKEVLMELLWPGAHPDAARNNLNVAIYGLRRALRKTRSRVSHVLFQDGCYLLNPELRIWVDAEAFMEHAAVARDREQSRGLAAAMSEYCAAEALYQGDFLEEDRYEDWPMSQRQSLRDEYLGLLERQGRYYLEQEDYAACATACRKMLAVDDCCEKAHRRLMRCYSRLGQHFLAMRQYHLCVETLAEHLDLAPAPRTVQLYHRIRSSDGR